MHRYTPWCDCDYCEDVRWEYRQDAIADARAEREQDQPDE